MVAIGPSLAECDALGLVRHQINFQPPDVFTYECRPPLAVTRESCPGCFATPTQEADIALARATGGVITRQGEHFRVGSCPPGTHPSPYNVAVCARDFVDDFSAGDFFKRVGIAVAQTAALVGSAGTLTPLTAAGAYGSQFVQALQAGGALNMGLDLGGIFGGVSQALAGVSSGNYWQALQGGFGAASAAFDRPSYATPSYMMPPMYPPALPAPSYPAPPAVQTAAPFSAAAGAIARLTAPILTKIAVKLGLRARPSLTRAMEMVRKAAKILTSPEAVATALGITVAELATLVTTSNARKRRRMNPANSKALRRAARRIKSFHKLCTHTDVLRGRSRGRSAVSFSRCGTCKKSPCKC